MIEKHYPEHLDLQSASGDTSSAAKPAPATETSRGKAATVSDHVPASGYASRAVKPAPVAETSSGKPGTMSDGVSASGDTSSAVKPAAVAAAAGKTEAESHAKVSTKRRKRMAAETQARSDIEQTPDGH